MKVEDLQLWIWPGHGDQPSVPTGLDHRQWQWAVALLYKDTFHLSGIYVHKDFSTRDMEIRAALSRDDIGLILVSDLQAVDRRWRIVFVQSGEVK